MGTGDRTQGALPDADFTLLCAFLDYLRSISGPDGLPIKGDMDPVALAKMGALASCWLVQRVDGDFVYRVAGDLIENAFGQPLIGRRLSEVLDEATAVEISRRWAHCLDNCSAYLNRGYVSAPKGFRYSGVRVAVPLLDRAGDATYLLGLTLYKEVTKVLDGPIITSIQSDNLSYFSLADTDPRSLFRTE
ncbi:MAG: PAS domain-containing protein [Alphaproteobacteria bacterium]